MRGYEPLHFDLRELVTPEIWVTRNVRCIELLDPRALRVLDRLREKFGPTTVNDWHIGGRFKESGLRDPFTSTGAMWSQHKFGRAFDCKFRNAKPPEVFAHVLQHADEYPEITVLEDVTKTPTWLHFDVRAADWEGIRVVRP